VAVFIAIALVRESLRTVVRYPLRSTLIILSAVLGSGGVISCVNYAAGGRQKVADQLGRLGTNVLIVSARKSRSVGGRAGTGELVTTLNEEDYSSIRREVTLFRTSSAFFERSFVVKAGNLVKNGCVTIGVEPAYIDIKRWAVEQGDFFVTADLRKMTRVAVLGSRAAKDLFEDSSPIGQRILINRVPFQVIGVMSERGQGLDSANEDDQIYVPLKVEMRRLANVDYYGGILLSVARWEDMDRAAEQVSQLLRARHRSVGAIQDDFQVQNQKQLLETQMLASGQLLFYVRCIGVGALLISGLGILAISWMGVKERTREIGTLRALGAARWHVFLRISSEAIALSLAGSVLGFGVGFETALFLAKWANQDSVFDKPAAWIAAIVSVTLNIAAAAIPASTAARLDPIKALRFE
jgi:putative ABC transport system permease protein